MKRSHAHLAFCLAALTFAAVAAYQGVRLENAQRVNAAIENAQAEPGEASAPEARFAQALAAANAGDYETASTEYKHFIQGDRLTLRRAALYNLGNLHLREAHESGAANAQRLPLIELAKQSYRDLLRETPGDWDARYNLERALQLAPESEDNALEEQGPPPDSERATSTISGARMELP